MRQVHKVIVWAALGVLVVGCSGVVSKPSTTEPSAEPSTAALMLQVPVSGTHGTHWTIWQYVDHDPSAGVRDYTGGGRSYDGHRGTDFGVPSFRSMDNDLVEIRAAAAGTVIVAVDGHLDRTVADSVETRVLSWRYS